MNKKIVPLILTALLSLPLAQASATLCSEESTAEARVLRLERGGVSREDAAQKYIDAYVFGGKRVSHFHYKLSQTYLLEPQRIHCSSVIPFTFKLGLNEYVIPGFVDLKGEDPFYFENVIIYLERILRDLEKNPFDEVYYRQTLLGTKLSILAAELCLIRINGSAAKERIDALVSLIDEITAEHKALWVIDNFAHGIEKSLDILASHRAELLAMRH